LLLLLLLLLTLCCVIELTVTEDDVTDDLGDLGTDQRECDVTVAVETEVVKIDRSERRKDAMHIHEVIVHRAYLIALVSVTFVCCDEAAGRISSICTPIYGVLL